MQWAQIRIETTVQARDAVAEIFMDNGCGGTEITGDAPVFVTCYLPKDDLLEDRLLNIRARMEDLPRAGLDPGTGEITIKHAEEKDWAEAWKQFFQTFRVGDRFVVKPDWEEYVPQPGDLVICMDPGMAFGTGSHPTTQLCMRLLEKYLNRGMTVVDFGTGSGILAIAEARLGASLVIAFDYDRVAVSAARENVRKNDLEEAIEVHQADDPAFVNVEVDLVTANLLAEIIIAESASIAQLLKPGGIAIASGIITDKSSEVEQSLRNAGFEIVETAIDGEWVAVVGRKQRHGGLE